jgi:hypothetical protein
MLACTSNRKFTPTRRRLHLAGSGKSYSMMGGTDEEKGIIPRLCEQVFSRIEEFTSETVSYKVRPLPAPHLASHPPIVPMCRPRHARALSGSLATRHFICRDILSHSHHIPVTWGVGVGGSELYGDL